MYRRILVAYDDSISGRKALDAALDLAAKHGVDLFVVTVALARDIPDGAETKALADYSMHRRRSGPDSTIEYYRSIVCAYRARREAITIPSSSLTASTCTGCSTWSIGIGWPS
jgi:nucleotide-binding universal stress UspA family protein